MASNNIEFVDQSFCVECHRCEWKWCDEQRGKARAREREKGPSDSIKYECIHIVIQLCRVYGKEFNGNDWNEKICIVYKLFPYNEDVSISLCIVVVLFLYLTYYLRAHISQYYKCCSGIHKNFEKTLFFLGLFSSAPMTHAWEQTSMIE